jgi:catechol 2,3-dioxygenase-like lactoylglutathione lyase family enzyme
MIEKVYHINFPVSDLKRAITFYEKVLGLQPRGKIEIFLTVDNIDKAYKELREKGVRFLSEPKDEHWGARAATFVDPDGNKFTIETFKK